MLKVRVSLTDRHGGIQPNGQDVTGTVTQTPNMQLNDRGEGNRIEKMIESAFKCCQLWVYMGVGVGENKTTCRV